VTGATFGDARPEDGAYIAYRVDGDGPIDVVFQPEWPGNMGRTSLGLRGHLSLDATTEPPCLGLFDGRGRASRPC
jgi:hypothetical protein